MNMDIVSEVLRAVRLNGAIFFDVENEGTWVSEAPHARLVAPRVMPDAQHVIEYHIVTEGHCWGAAVDAPDAPERLGPGSVIAFPHGDAHVLSSAPGMRAAPCLEIFDGREGQALPYRVEHKDGAGERVGLICGFLGCDLLPFNPLIQSLPKCLHVADGYTAEDGWLKGLIAGIVRESRERRVGGGCMLAKLSELIFIELVRRYVEQQPHAGSGWFAALADPHAGRALRLLHGEPRRAWSLEALARAVGTSRTVLIERFNAHLGVPPMTYLAGWRMQLAAGMLCGGSQPVARIAEEIGYESEAAFSRAFKRFTGVSPARWRTDAEGRRAPALAVVEQPQSA